MGWYLGIADIILALGLTIEAVLPESHFYGTVYSQGSAANRHGTDSDYFATVQC